MVPVEPLTQAWSCIPGSFSSRTLGKLVNPCSWTDSVKFYRQTGFKILFNNAWLSKVYQWDFMLLRLLHAVAFQPSWWLASPWFMLTPHPGSVTSCPSPVLCHCEVKCYNSGRPFHGTLHPPAPCYLAATQRLHSLCSHPLPSYLDLNTSLLGHRNLCISAPPHMNFSFRLVMRSFTQLSCHIIIIYKLINLQLMLQSADCLFPS